MEHLFAAEVKSSTPSALWVEAGKLERKLLEWTERLPEDLRFQTQDDLQKAPPHCLTLHMQWECAKIALQLPL